MANYQRTFPSTLKGVDTLEEMVEEMLDVNEAFKLTVKL